MTGSNYRDDETHHPTRPRPAPFLLSFTRLPSTHRASDDEHDKAADIRELDSYDASETFVGGFAASLPLAGMRKDLVPYSGVTLGSSLVDSSISDLLLVKIGLPVGRGAGCLRVSVRVYVRVCEPTRARV